MKTKFWLLILGGLLLASLLFLLFLGTQGEKSEAVISVNGEERYRLDLQEDRELTVESRWGSNIVSVKNGKIAVLEADCPTQICVLRGYQNSGIPIICLPHRLVISFADSESVDAWTK